MKRLIADNTIRIFLRFVYEKVTKLLDIHVLINKFSPFNDKTVPDAKKLIDRIMLFVKKWDYF